MSTKTLFKLLWVPFVTSVFASCSDKEELPYTPPEETNDSYISPAVPQGNSWPEASMSLTQPFLGAGYDIMGSYIDNNSVKEPVLDLSKIDNEKISNLVGSSGVGDSFIGRDMKEFLRSITEYKKFVVPAETKMICCSPLPLPVILIFRNLMIIHPNTHLHLVVQELTE